MHAAVSAAVSAAYSIPYNNEIAFLIIVASHCYNIKVTIIFIAFEVMLYPAELNGS